MPASPVREKILDLVAGTMTLTEFKAWLYPNTWEETEEAGLANFCKLLFAEHDLGHRTEREVRDELHARTRFVVMGIPGATPLETGSQDTLITLSIG